jgi:RNA polymerase sigma-70 factor (ECF subfamily)
MPPSGEEIELFRRIAARDREALAQFYDQAAGPLFSLALRILGDPPEAEEVVQDVFVQIWDKAAWFNPAMGSPLHWALSITRNRSIDRLRARQRRSRLATELEAAANPVADDANGPGPLPEDELAAIRSAVKGLPADQRQAIELAFFGGLTHLEIAQAMKEPLGTVKARIRRGMLKLRDSLQPYA